MQNCDLEREYLHEYIDVEKICKDMYRESGVTAYINDMQNCTSREKNNIINWDKKLMNLKHLRGLRNQITHENYSYEVTEQDFTDIKAFHDELLTQQDPLALLHKEIESTKKKQQEYKLQQKQMQKTVQQPIHNNATDYQDDNNSSKTIAIVAVVAVVVIIAIAFLLFH